MDVEVLLKLVAAILGAGGIFASTGVIEILQKLTREVLARRKREAVVGKGRSITMDSAFPEETEPPSRGAPPHEPTEKPSRLEPLNPKLSARRLPTEPSETPPPPQSSQLRLFYALLLVFSVFAISIGVIWSLTHIGGPIEASVKATIEKAGGSFLLVGSGLFGAFFAVAILAFAAIHVFSKRLDP
jgi:hypothetical protein